MILDPNDVERQFQQFTGLGNIASPSDFIMEVDGMPDVGLLVKTFPIPYATVKGEKEIFLRYGLSVYQPQQLKLSHTGGISIQETEKGHLREFLRQKYKGFSGRVIHGTKESPLLILPITKAFIMLEDPDADVEAVSTGMVVSGSIFFTHIPFKKG